VAVGVKVIPTVQLRSGSRGVEVEQVVVLGSTAKSPETVNAEKVSDAAPLLVMITACAALVLPTT